MIAGKALLLISGLLGAQGGMEARAEIDTLVVEDHALPNAGFYLVLKTGTAEDPAGKEGLANLAARLLLRGTSSRTRTEIEDEVETLGSTMDVQVGRSYITIGGEALSRHLGKTVEVLADCVLRPSFPEGELEKLRAEVEDGRRLARENDMKLAGMFFRKFAFGSHPYANPVDGLLESVKKLTREDVADFHKRHFVKGNVLLAAFGDVTKEQVSALGGKHFGALPDGSAPAAAIPPPPSLSNIRCLIADKPDRTQAQIFIGHFGLPASSPDYFALEAANTAFGGAYTGRLMKEVREERGLSYGAYSQLVRNRTPDLFFMWVFPEAGQAGATVKLVLDMYASFRKDGLSPDEVSFAKSRLANAFPFMVETAEKKLAALIDVVLMGLPPDYLDTYVKKTGAVSGEDVKKVIEKYVHPSDLVVVMVGQASVLKAILEKEAGIKDITVVPFDSL